LIGFRIQHPLRTVQGAGPAADVEHDVVRAKPFYQFGDVLYEHGSGRSELNSDWVPALLALEYSAGQISRTAMDEQERPMRAVR
jgi:hypothetical protein